MLFMSMLLTAHASTFVEDFGTLQTTGCDSQWATDCEQDWDGFGPADTLGICETSPGDYVFSLDDSTATYRGIERTFPLTTGDEFFGLVASGTFEAGDIRMGAQFLDGNGGVIDAVQNTQAVSAGVSDVSFAGAIPTNAVEVRFRVGSPSAGLANIDNLKLNTNLFPFQQDCQDRADEYEENRERNCANQGGEWLGLCAVLPHPQYPILCTVECKGVCLIEPDVPVGQQCF